MKFKFETRTVTIGVVLLLVGIGVAGSLFSADSSALNSSEGSVVWRGFDEGLAQAQKENKKVLVDVYTDWCVWCKKMDKEVYATSEISSILGAHFVAVKLNPEKPGVITYGNEHLNGGMFAQAMGVSGYPSTLILDSDGKPITKIDGYQEAKSFSKILRYIGENHYKTKSFQEFSASLGTRSGE